MDYDNWLTAVNSALSSQGKPYDVSAVDPLAAKAAFLSGQSPVVFARTVQPPMPASLNVHQPPIQSPVPISQSQLGTQGNVRMIGPVDYWMLGFIYRVLKVFAWLWWIGGACYLMFGLVSLSAGARATPSGSATRTQASEDTARGFAFLAGMGVFAVALLFAAVMFMVGVISMLLAQLIPLAVSAHEKLDGKDRP